MRVFKFILKIPYIIYFIFYYIWEVFLSNLEVAWEVITPHNTMRPGIVAVPLDTTNEFAINLLANLITMTPGTMSVDVSPDHKILYVYALHITDVDDFRKKIKKKSESKVIKLFE